MIKTGKDSVYTPPLPLSLVVHGATSHHHDEMTNFLPQDDEMKEGEEAFHLCSSRLLTDAFPHQVSS